MIRSEKRRAAGEGSFELPRRLYLNRDGKVVEADDPSRITLLGPVGGKIPMERARELGLAGQGAEAKSQGEARPDEAKPDPTPRPRPQSEPAGSPDDDDDATGTKKTGGKKH